MSERDSLLLSGRNGLPLYDEEKAVRSVPPEQQRAAAAGGLQRKGEVSKPQAACRLHPLPCCDRLTQSACLLLSLQQADSCVECC